MKNKKILKEIKKELEWVIGTTDDDLVVVRCSKILDKIEELINNE